MKNNIKINIFLLATALALQNCSSNNLNFKKKEETKSEIKNETIITSSISSTYFSEKSKEYGISNIKAVRFYAVDLDKDGFVDLVTLPNDFSIPEFYFYNSTNHQFQKDEGSVFKLINSDNLPQGHFLNFVDLDNDSILDLIVGVFAQKSELTQKKIRIFKGSIKNHKYYLSENYMDFSFPILPASNITALDFNLDGKLDLFIPLWFDYHRNSVNTIMPSLLYVQDKNNKLQNRSDLLTDEYLIDKASQTFSQAVPITSSSTCDVNNDGLPDLLTTASNRFNNKLWINNIDGFKDFGISSGYAKDEFGNNGNGTFAVCTDYNNDGIMDIFLGSISHSYENETIDKSNLLTGINNLKSIRFLRTEYPRNSSDQYDRNGIWLDYNQDGLLDLLIENSDLASSNKLVLLEQQTDNTFIDKAKELNLEITNPKGTISLDINRDGKVDILTTINVFQNGKKESKLLLLINQNKTHRSKLFRIFIRGKKSNSYGLNSKVTFKTNEVKRTMWSEYNYGGLPSQSEEGLFFAIPNSEKIENINVTFPYKQSNNKVLNQTFKLNDINKSDKSYFEITLCDNGKYYKRKLYQCP
ncbi:MAG: VCBS repeat-containing protein [Bacteriovoracaceae bacterium]